MKATARAVSLSVKLINISLFLGNVKTKSVKNSAGLSCYKC